MSHPGDAHATRGAPPAIDPTAPIVIPARRPVRRRLAIAVAAGSLLAVGVTGAVVGASDAAGRSGLRTAEVDRQEVVETLDLTGTIAPVARAAVAFPTGGTVETVDVVPGDRVEIGEVLATLDTDDLDDAIVAAEEAVAAAELSLEQALAGEQVTGDPDGATPSGSSTGRQPTAVGAGSSLADLVVVPVAAAATPSATSDRSSSDAELAAAQQAVLAAAQAVDDALATADASLALAAEVCGALDGATGDDGTLARQCQSALAQVLADQQVAAEALDALGSASDALDALLAARAEDQAEDEADPGADPGGDAGGGGGAPTSSPSTDGGSAAAAGEGAPSGGDGVAGAPTGASDGSGAAGADGTSASTQEASAEQLVAYQSAVDAAAAQLAVAEQALDQATIVSPLAGTVVSVDLAVGDDVTAASSTSTVIVVGDGGYEVTTTVAVDDVADVEIGQAARVSVDGIAAAVEGEVVAVGLTPVTGDSGRVYPVTIGLTSSAEVRSGTLAEVALELDRSTDAVAVPTSAVDLSGDQARVTVVDDDGSTRAVPVVLGAVGGAYVEVEGVEVGATVVLADLAEPLPDRASESTGGGATFGGPPGVDGSGGRPSMVLSGGPPG